MNLFKGVGDFFALDVGTSSIRIVQLSGSEKTGWSLQGYGYASVDPKIAQSNSEDGKRKLGEAVLTVIGQSGIKTKNVAISLPASKTFTTVIDVPNQPLPEVQKLIKYQLDQYVPMAVDDAKVDWSIMGQSPRDGAQIEVLLSSVAKDYSEERMEFVESLGLNVVAMEPDPIAMSRSLNPAGVPDARLIIDFGEVSTDLVVTYADAPRLVRSIPGGLQALIKAAAQNLNIKDDQAKQFILKFGLAQDKLEGQVVKALESTLDNFAAEIVKSAKFFQTKYSTIPIGGVLLAGFAGAIPMMSQYIETKTSIPTIQGNPWQRVNVSKQYQDQLLPVASEFAVAIGLAERGNENG
ncbi:MAG: pilus assembly protein PilM [Candidatus Nomurabacteria bacterium]|jgi:type IV pilus assembly protein PilM|nr:pilus assembly protein PilM [Candidatus Nomurabacteria bacterium]